MDITELGFAPDPSLSAARCRGGVMTFPAGDIYVGRSLAVYGEWCPQETRVLSTLLRPGDIVVEVGANIGAHSVELARTVGPGGRIYSIEPQPRIHQLLSVNAALNGLHQIRPIQSAIGEMQGYVRLPDIDYAKAGNFGGVSPVAEGTETSNDMPHRVPLCPLDDLLDLPRLRLLKMDVEGWEPQVLRGARGCLERFRPFIYAEADQPAATVPILDAVAGLGYRAFWHVSPLFVADNYNGVSENVFGGTTCINMLLVPEGAQVRSHRPVTGPESHPRA